MRIIIVDDEPEILDEITETILEIEGFSIAATYTNPLKALCEITITNPECAFVDIEMPGMTGIDLAERLLEYNPDMDIIFITAFNYYATEAFEVNALDYLLKPIHSSRFIKTAERILEKHNKTLLVQINEVTIRSLGNFDVSINGSPVKWKRAKAKELFAYLLHYSGRKKNKYKICDDLWPGYEPKQALVNLQTTICSLRKSLGSAGIENVKISFTDESYVLDIINVYWDQHEFDKLYFEAIVSGEAGIIQKAIDLYHGDYMSSEDWSWSQLTTEIVARKYEKLLSILVEIYYKNERYWDISDVATKLILRRLDDINIQIILLDSVYKMNGIKGLSQQFSFLQKLYRKEYDEDIDPQIIAFCKSKGLT